jgi:aquaporin Z
MVGTAILLAVGLSAICLDFGPGSPVVRGLPTATWRLLLTGLVFAGTGSLVAISPLGRRSGAHLNPAVTFAFWLRGKVHPHDLAGYIAAQVAGAGLGVELVAITWGGTARAVRFGATSPGTGISTPMAAVIEAAMTAVLVGVISGMLSSMRTARWTPLVVWLVAAALVWQGARFTGTGLNPARSLWPDLLAGRLDVYWVYLAGPLLGAAIAVGASRLVPGHRGPLTAKMFHDAAYPSVFDTEM